MRPQKTNKGEKIESNFCNSVKLSYLTELEIKKVLCPEKPESVKIVQVIVIWDKEKTLRKRGEG